MRKFSGTAVLATVFLVSAICAASADPCVFGTNRPGSDVNPAQRIDPNAPQMRCTQTVTERRVDTRGTTQQVKTWNFAIGK